VTALEIERKFRVLVDTFDWSTRFEALAAWEVWQGYLTAPPADVEVRVRRLLELSFDSLTDFRPDPVHDDLGRPHVRQLIAVKWRIPTAGSGGLSRHEAEASVDDEFFRQAWDACGARRLRKVRIEYMVDMPPGGPRVVVVDTFKDRLEGLVMAEVEFETWTDSDRFEPPDFLGPEVTHDSRYLNASLAVAGAPPA
jgi:CYTH domain-containing protein